MSTALSGESAPRASGAAVIRVRGARVHNLCAVDVDIPRDQLVVVTGPSGSGKSSLAFDTLFAEGQRQFLESLAVNIRRRFDQLPRPEVDRVEGLPPTVCIDQRSGSPGPRGTVATATEIHDHLRLLMARVGQPHCPGCGDAIRQQTPAQIEQELLDLPDGTKLMLLAPRPPVMNDGLGAAIAQIRKAGLLRVRIDGELFELDAIPADLPEGPHRLEMVVDRIVTKPAAKSRLLESLRLALREGDDVVTVCVWEGSPGRDAWRELLFSTRHACPRCQISLEVIEPRTFNFHSPYGACPECGGWGLQRRDDAKAPEVVCQACGGSRLRPLARCVRLGGAPIHEITRLTVREAREFFQQLTFSSRQLPIAQPVLLELERRLGFLEQVGVPYLTLDRRADTLSGGEFQRVRLASSLGSGLCGVCYVLDEPSVGLHPRDNHRLVAALRGLQVLGNTLVVVEHDEAMMRQADWLIDIGPGAGSLGGRVLATGTLPEVIANPQSVTGRWLAPASPSSDPRNAGRGRALDRWLVLEGAQANNLRNLTVEFPLGCLVAVAGVSGSGKSTLIHDTLAPALQHAISGEGVRPGGFRELRGWDQVDKVILVDQSPIGRSPRSNPATYTGIYDPLRSLFAATREAKRRGFRASRFSFNAAGGRCEECQGNGVRKLEMNFLPDLFVGCSACGGTRFNRQTLAIRYRGKSIADVLAMSSSEALAFFENVEEIARPLRSLTDIGLGYLPLGQPATTLSGGEAQRLKLATELARRATGRTVYLLDEPTSGLHFEDVRRLLSVLHGLVDGGNTVMVIEHHLDVLAAADWLIELGPDGGTAGGELVAVGRPAEVATHPTSPTGRFLRVS